MAIVGKIEGLISKINSFQSLLDEIKDALSSSQDVVVLSTETAVKVRRCLETLSLNLGSVAPRKHQSLYSDLNEVLTVFPPEEK